ncbi:MAG: hypothetical protein ABW039_13430, partial [Sphingobium sp.]
MAESKPIASLTPNLLARKGAAQPAMRRPMLGFGRAMSPAQSEDLGWNDMGFDQAPHAPAAGPVSVPVSAPTSAALPPVVAERAMLADRIAEAAPDVPQKPAAVARRAAFTLRLEADRHLRLRLACTMLGRSAQQIVTEALDEFLKE